MPGIIGRKIGMTSIFSAEGKAAPCTVIEAGPCVVTQVKTLEKDGYEAIQLGYGEKKEKNTPNPLKGHFKKANTTPKMKLAEFRDFDSDLNLGDVVTLDTIFAEGDFVDVIGNSKGKGFQGVVKRHGYAGVGETTHGHGGVNRTGGSIGMASTPARIFKGKAMAGQMGNERVQIQNLLVLKVLADKNLLIVKGSVPGAKGSTVLIKK